MIRVKTLIVFSILATSQLIWTASADAGPLLDWLRGRRCNNNQVLRPATAAPTTCGTCTTTCQQTCQRVVVNYVPYTAYRSSWERVPVTTYRQSSSTDPCTGCTVTCNRPCTTYTWRMKQEPFTTYRPVYRTETYRTPVTYTSAMPASPCNTCASPGFATGTPVIQQSPVIQQAPVGTINPGTTFTPLDQSSAATGGAIFQQAPITGGSAADLQPSLNPQIQQRPIIGGEGSSSRNQFPTQINTQPTRTTGFPAVRDRNPSARWNNQSAPQLLSPFNHSASNTPSVERWNYSPVKLASYQAPLKTPVALQPEQPKQQPVARNNGEYVGSFTTSPRPAAESNWQRSLSAEPQQQSRLNEGWRKD